MSDCLGCGLELHNGKIRPLTDPTQIAVPLDGVTAPVAGQPLVSGTPETSDCSGLKWDCETGEIYADPEPCCQRFKVRDAAVISSSGTQVTGQVTKTLELCGDCDCKPNCIYIYGCVQLCVTTEACQGYRVFGNINVDGRVCPIADGLGVDDAQLGKQTRTITTLIQNVVFCRPSIVVSANVTAFSWVDNKPLPFEVTANFDVTAIHMEC